MEEEALNDAHGLFVKTGYNGNVNDFKNLVSKDSEALNDAHKLFVKTGYNGDVNEFSNLIGLKKKDTSKPTSQVPPKVSPIQTKGRQSLLATENQKQGAVLDGLNGVTSRTTGIFLAEKNKKPNYNLPVPKVKVKKESALSELGRNMIKGINKGIDFATYVSTWGEQPTGYNIPGGDEDAIQLAAKVKEITDITPKISKVNEDYIAAKQGGSWWDKTKVAVSEGINTLSDLTAEGFTGEAKGPRINVAKPLKKFQEDVVKQAAKNNEVLTKEEKDRRVEVAFKTDRIHSEINSQLNSFNYSLSPKEQEMITSMNKEDSDKLNDTQNQLIKSTALTSAIALSATTDYVNLYKKLADNQKNNVPISQEDVNGLSILKDKAATYNDHLKKLYENYAKNTEEIGTFEQEKAVFDNETNRVIDIWKRVGAAETGLLGNAFDFAAWGANAIANAPEAMAEIAKSTLNLANKLPGNQAAGYLSNQIESISPYIPENKGAEIVSDVFHLAAANIAKNVEKQHQYLAETRDANSVEDYINKTINFTVESAPIVALASTGIGGLAVMTATSAGGFYGEMVKEEGKADGKKYSQWQKIVAPALYGSAMAVPVAQSMKVIKNGSKVWASAEKQFPGLVKQSIQDYSTRLVKKVAKFGGETFDTAVAFKVAGIIQNVGVNHFMLDKPVDYKELVDMKIFEAAGFHLMNKAVPHLMGTATKPFFNNEEYKTLDNNSRKIIELTKELDNPNIDANEKSVVQNSIDKIAKSSTDLIDSKLNQITSLPDKLKNEVIDAFMNTSKIREKALSIKTSDVISDSQKPALLKDLKAEYMKEDQKRIDILNGERTLVDTLPLEAQDKLKKEALNELTAELNPDGKKNITITDKQIKNRANRNIIKEEIAKAKEEATVKPTEVVTKEAEGTPDVISQPIELSVEKPTEKVEATVSEEITPKEEVLTKPETTITEKEAEVERLREEEVKEKEAVNPRNKKKLKEIYDRYDKLISPLLRDIESAKAIEEVTPEVTSEAQPSKVEVKPIEEGPIKPTLETSKDFTPAPKPESKKVKDLKEQLSDIKKQVTDVMAAMKQFAAIDKKEAVDVQKKKLSDLNNAKRDLGGFIRANVSSKLNPSVYKKLINLVENVNASNFDKSLDAVVKVMDKIKLGEEKVEKENLLNEIKEALDISNLLIGKEKVSKSKITADSKKELMKLQDQYRGVDFDKLSTIELNDILTQAKDIIAEGKLSQASKKRNNEIRREYIKNQGILSVAKKNSKVDYTEFNAEKELANGNYVVIEGEIYSKKDIEEVSNILEEYPEIEKGLIRIQSSKDNAVKAFKKANSFMNKIKNDGFSSIKNIPKNLFKASSRYTTGIRTHFEDLISDDATNDFLNNNIINPLEQADNRKHLRKAKNKKFYDDSINKIFGITPSGIFTRISQVYNSKSVQSYKEFLNSRKPGTLDNMLYTKTEFSFKDKNGQNIFDGLTDSHIVQVYNVLRSPDGVKALLNLMPVDSTVKDVLPIIEYVNKNAKLKEVADAIPTWYENILPEFNEKLDAHEYNTIDAEKYLTPEEVYSKAISKKKTEAEASKEAENHSIWLKAMYGDNIPENVPYVPLSAEAKESKQGSVLDAFNDPNDPNPFTTLFPNMFSRTGGGTLVIKPFQEVFSVYNNNVSTFIENSGVMSDVRTLLNTPDSANMIIENHGSQWLNNVRSKSLDIITGGTHQSEAAWRNAISKFANKANASLVVANPVSAVSQLVGVGSSYMSLTSSQKLRYTKIITDKKLNSKYISELINSPLLYDRMNHGAGNYDMKKILQASEENGTPIENAIDNAISDGLYATTIADATNIVYGGSAAYGAIYEGKLSEYSKTMSPDKAKQKAYDEAQIEFFTMVESTQQSSQNAFMGEFQKDSVVRLFTLSAFSSSAVQGGAKGMRSMKDIVNGRGNKVENYSKAAYYLFILPALFTIASSAIGGNPDDEKNKAKRINDLSNNLLQQFSIAGKAVEIAKDFALEQICPRAIGLNVKRKKNSYETVGRLLSQLSPFIGAKIRDYNKVANTTDNVPTYRRVSAGVSLITSAPVDRFTSITNRIYGMADSDFKMSDRFRVLFAKINDNAYFAYKKDVDAIKNDAKNVKLNVSEERVYSLMDNKDDAEKYKKDILQNRQVDYIDHQLDLLKKNGLEYKKENMRYSQYIKDYNEGLKADNLDNMVSFVKNKDLKSIRSTEISVLKEIINNKEVAESDKVDIFENFIKGVVDAMKEDNSMILNMKKQSPGVNRANALYNAFGDLAPTNKSDEALKMQMLQMLLDKDVMDNKTMIEYGRIVRSKR